MNKMAMISTLLDFSFPSELFHFEMFVCTKLIFKCVDLLRSFSNFEYIGQS